MPKKTGSAPQFAPSGTSTPTTPTSSSSSSKQLPSPTAISTVWALICLYVWFECKEKKVAKTDQIEQICIELAQKHAVMFVEGNGVYDHPACKTMRDEYAFSAEEFVKTLNGKAIQRKGQLVERDIKNVLIPALYKSSLLDPPNYTIASGKNAADLLLDVKKHAWEKNGNKAEDFKDGQTLNRYHASFFPFLVTSPLSDYVYQRQCHPFFKSCVKGPRAQPSAAEGKSTEKKRGRNAQREEERGKKSRNSPDDFPASASASASAMAFADADERKTTSDILMFLIKEGTPEDKQDALKELRVLAFSKRKAVSMNEGAVEQDDSGGESDEVQEEEE